MGRVEKTNYRYFNAVFDQCSYTRLLNEDGLWRYTVKASIPPEKATCLNLPVSVAGPLIAHWSETPYDIK